MQLSYRVVLAVAARLGLLGELGAKFSHTKKVVKLLYDYQRVYVSAVLPPASSLCRVVVAGSLHLVQGETAHRGSASGGSTRKERKRHELLARKKAKGRCCAAHSGASVVDSSSSEGDGGGDISLLLLSL